MAIQKLALFGTPGAGKSTSARLLEELCSERRASFYRIRLADPIYQCQAEIYRIAGRPLSEFYVQDGELLNFLGAHLRRINPTVLIESFSSRLDSIMTDLKQTSNGHALIVCDDMRMSESAFMLKEGFSLVRVDAPHEVCRLRRASRGDMTLGSEHHSTEMGLDDVKPNAVIENNSTIESLRQELGALLETQFA
jgi:cytidine deaminase